MRQSIRTEVEKCKTQNLTLNIFLPLSPSVSSSASCLMMSVIFSPIFCAGLQMRMRSIEGWGTDMRRSESESSENWNPTKSWSQWMIHNVTPNKGSNDVTLPKTPRPSLLGLLSSKTLPLQPLSDNQCQTFCQKRFFIWTSSMKPAAVPKSGPGQNWPQLWRTKQGKLSAKSFHPIWKNKNQKTFPFFFLAAVISCVNIFLPFPSSFHSWYDVSNDI